VRAALDAAARDAAASAEALRARDAKIGDLERVTGRLGERIVERERELRDVREELAAALVRPVQWRATVGAMLDDGIDELVEPGPGAVLKRLEKRIRREREALVA
jgi:malonyl CoA-acyl carrier protein transacylase